MSLGYKIKALLNAKDGDYVKMLMSSKGSLLTFNFLDLFLLLVNLGLNLLLTEGPPVDGWTGGCLLEKLLQAFRRNRGRLLNTALSYLSSGFCNNY